MTRSEFTGALFCRALCTCACGAMAAGCSDQVAPVAGTHIVAARRDAYAAVAPSCGTGCTVLAGPQGIGVALASDSVAFVHIADVVIAGNAGDTVWVRVTGSDTERGVLPATGSLIATLGDQSRSFSLRRLAAAAEVYVFEHADTVSIRYELKRTRSPHPLLRTIRVEQVAATATLLAAATGFPAPVSSIVATCTVSAPGPSTCPDISVAFTPYAPGDPFGEFQSDPGTGASNPITVTFSHPVRNLSVTAADPTFAGNLVIAFDSAGNEITRSDFAFSGVPGAFSVSTRVLSVSQIKSIRLVPAAADYVAYSGLSFSPADTCPPTGDAFLDSIAVRTALSRAWHDSYADSIPASVRRERGGFILQDTLTGIVSAMTSYDLAATPCSNSPPVPTVSQRPPNSRIVGAFHTHPFAHGDVLPTSCNPPNDQRAYGYDAISTGGLSPNDWSYANTGDGVEVYVIDRDRVYRGGPGVAASNRARRAAVRRLTYGPSCR